MGWRLQGATSHSSFLKFGKKKIQIDFLLTKMKSYHPKQTCKTCGAAYSQCDLGQHSFTLLSVMALTLSLPFHAYFLNSFHLMEFAAIFSTNHIQLFVFSSLFFLLNLKWFQVLSAHVLTDYWCLPFCPFAISISCICPPDWKSLCSLQGHLVKVTEPEG